MIKYKEIKLVQDKKIAEANEQTGLIESTHENDAKKLKKSVEHEVDNSIFDFAFVSLLDPAVMEDW